MVKAWLVSFYRQCRRQGRWIGLGLLGAIAGILFAAQLKAFIAISILGFAATFSTYYKRIFQAPPVFELTTLTTVAVAVFYGPFIGALYTLVVSISSEVASQALDPFSITYIFPRVVVAFAAPWLYANGMSIPVLGLLMSLLYNALQQPVYLLLTDIEKRIKALYFTALNVPLNFLIFKFIGVPLFEILGRLS